jgi:hypothetical protein
MEGIPKMVLDYRLKEWLTMVQAPVLSFVIAALSSLVCWETLPRLCRGGSRSLTNTAVHRGNSSM